MVIMFRREEQAPPLRVGIILPNLFVKSFCGGGTEGVLFSKSTPSVKYPHNYSYLFNYNLRLGVGGAVLFYGTEIICTVVVCHVDLKILPSGSLGDEAYAH